MNIKNAMQNLKNLTTNELLGLRRMTLDMKWSLKKAGALALIQAEIERRVATEQPKLYAAGWAINIGAAYLGYDLAEWAVDNIV